MKSILVAVGLVSLLCGTATAGDLLLSEPIWKSAPSAADAERAFAHIHPGERGLASRLRCTVMPTGSLQHCQNILPASPGAMVRAAMALIPMFVVVVPSGAVDRHDALLVDVGFRLDPPEDGDASVYLDVPEIVGIDPGSTSAGADGGNRGNGFALVKASVDGAGALNGCTVVREVPADDAFGSRACAVAQTWRLNLWQNGYAVAGGQVRIPVYINTANADDDPHFTRKASFHPPAWSAGAGPFYPDRAARQGVTGQAILECVVAASGALSDCIPIADTPPGEEFDLAALVMARRGAITAPPTLVNGQAASSDVVKVEVPFNNPPLPGR